VASSHSVYNQLLPPGSTHVYEDDVWLDDDDSQGTMSDSRLAFDSPSPPDAAAMRYSNFLMRDSVIDQRLAGVNLDSNFDALHMDNLGDGGHWIDRVDDHPSSARAAAEQEGDPVDSTCYRSAIGPRDGAA